MNKLILNLCVLGVLGGHIQAASVEAEGRAPGDMKPASKSSPAGWPSKASIPLFSTPKFGSTAAQ
jgi:hypothetical protein